MPREQRAWINPQPHTNGFSPGIPRRASGWEGAATRPLIPTTGGSQPGIDAGAGCAGVLAPRERVLGETASPVEPADALAEAIRPPRRGAAANGLHTPIRRGGPTR